MKKFIFLLLSFIITCTSYAQILNGAWRLVEENGVPVKHEAIKLFSNSYFTYSAYDQVSGEFIEARGGTYTLTNLSYKEHLDIDSNEPQHSGKTLNYHNSLDGKSLTLLNLMTGDEQVWEKFDDADNYEMAFCWRIHKKKDEGDTDWRTIEYRPRKTLKMITNNRYQVLALNSETGQFVGSSGGRWTGEDDTYIEHVEFFSKDQTNVGRSLKFKRAFVEGLWLHTGKTTKGEDMMEKWHRYK
jgi:hypothetical protein